MSLNIEINQSLLPPGKRFVVGSLKKVINRALKEIRVKKGSISIALVPPRVIKKLNFIYLGKNYTTDVLSFPLSKKAGKIKRPAGYAGGK